MDSGSRYRIPDSLSVEFIFLIPIVVGFRISWAVIRILKPRILDSTRKRPLIPDSTSKNFPDSRIRILLHIYRTIRSSCLVPSRLRRLFGDNFNWLLITSQQRQKRPWFSRCPAFHWQAVHRQGIVTLWKTGVAKWNEVQSTFQVQFSRNRDHCKIKETLHVKDLNLR